MTRSDNRLSTESRVRGSPALGVVYTRPAVVSLTLDLADYRPTRDLTGIKALDIGCGYGQFVGEMANRLVASCLRKGLNRQATIDVLVSKLRGVEIDPRTAHIARTRVANALSYHYGGGRNQAAWTHDIIKTQDFLDRQTRSRTFDLIAGNLPYVKYEMIDQLPRGKGVDWLRATFDCFKGRADYSVAFLEKAITLLSARGSAALIASNRFTQTEYGRSLRRLLAAKGDRLLEIDLRSVRAFDEDVTAYASVFLYHGGRPGKSKYIHLRSIDERALAHLANSRVERVRNSKWYAVCTRGVLPRDGEPWSPFPQSVTRLLRRLTRRFPSLEMKGFSFGKGPATGADKVFVRALDDFPLSRSTKDGFLLPLFHSGSSYLDDSEIPDRYLVSVYSAKTKRLVELNEFPSDLKDFLAQHKRELRQRYMVREQGRRWWSTIDPFDPDLLRTPKVLIPDLHPGDAIRVDSGQLFPAHTVIYAAGDHNFLHQVSHVLRSPLSDLYRILLSPTLRNGTPRASPRAIARIPCPPLEELANDGIDRKGFRTVYAAYHLSNDDIRLLERTHSSFVGSS